ncbi:hypothetical protein QMK33_19675 [Hymenobacter sp. H14-R3]|uniref:hypothetical protein n=1 Tax=Hymenobacter sp. H14-R3 TaxID=3046308 RepID=UPI0024BB4EF1|nr:hypothetical protein [Hymenobacter sp. H14-R3]MDJ0367374.1 hypothetical protein [Hymenobacter sp. H14-R3]
MKHFLLLAAGLALASCAAQRQLTPLRPSATDVVSLLNQARPTNGGPPYEARPSTIAPPPSFDARGKTPAQSYRKQGRILRRWQRQFQRAAARTKAAPAVVPRKCKGCTIVYGDATVASKKATVAAGDGAVASVVEKKAGPAVVGSDSVSQNTVGTGNLAATNGDGNTTSQTKADVEPPGVGATIAAAFAQPLGKVLAVVVLGGVIGGVVWWRKKSLF